jgi:hypothetical protein
MKKRKTRINRTRTIKNKLRNKSRKIKGGVRSSYSYTRGSDLRYELVQLCKHNKWDEYYDLTQQIIDDYYSRNDNSFFIHLQRNYFGDSNSERNKGFNFNTKMCLEKALTRFQEEAIPESMPFLYDIMKLKGKA